MLTSLGPFDEIRFSESLLCKLAKSRVILESLAKMIVLGALHLWIISILELLPVLALHVDSGPKQV